MMEEFPNQNVAFYARKDLQFAESAVLRAKAAIDRLDKNKRDIEAEATVAKSLLVMVQAERDSWKTCAAELDQWAKGLTKQQDDLCQRWSSKCAAMREAKNFWRTLWFLQFIAFCMSVVSYWWK